MDIFYILSKQVPDFDKKKLDGCLMAAYLAAVKL